MEVYFDLLSTSTFVRSLPPTDCVIDSFARFIIPPHLFREEQYRYAAVVYLPQCEIPLKLVSPGREFFCGARNRLSPAVPSLTDTDALVPVGYLEFLRELNRIGYLPIDIMPRCEIAQRS